MAKLLQEYSALNYDRKLVKEAKEKGQPISVPALLQRCDKVNQNGRVYPRSILEREMERYQEVIADGRATGECVPGDTEIWTLAGWKKIKNISPSEKIYTLNLETNKIELQEINHKVYKKYEGKLVHIKNNSTLDMKLSEGHKVLLFSRTNKPYILTALELHKAIQEGDSRVDHSYLRRSGEWQGESPEYFELGPHKIRTEDWAAFLGFYIAEGHCSGTKGGTGKEKLVGVTQKKEAEKQMFAKLLERLPFEHKLRQDRQFIFKDRDLYNHLKPLGNSYEKHIPEYAKQWNLGLLNILLDWLLLGDGRNRKDRKGKIMKEYCTTSSRLAEDVQELMIKLGKGGNISTRIPVDREIEDRIILAENSKPLMTVHMHTTKGVYLTNRFTSSELIDCDDEYVYCVNVPNKTWLMRQNGKAFWTHNCDHPDSSVINLSNVSHVIRETWWEGDEVWGRVEVLDTPKGKLIQTLMNSGIKIGISSRGLGEIVKNESGHECVDDSFTLLGFDLVSEPSTHQAFLMNEGKDVSLEEYRQAVPKDRRVEQVLNEILKD